MLLHSPSIIQDASPKIVNDPLTLILGGGSDIVAGLCAHKGDQHCDYGLILSRRPVIIQDARPEISNTPLTLISRIGKRACCLPFYI